MNYPPYKRFIKITHHGTKDEAREARETLRQLLPDCPHEIFGGFVPKLKNKFVTHALLRLEPRNWSLPELSLRGSIDQKLSGILNSLPPNFRVFVDPEDLL